MVNLGVPIMGKRPRKRPMIGDDEFERSPGRAMEAHDKQLRKLAEDRTGEKTLTKLAELETGETVDILVFPMLREEVERARAATGGKGFCFPAAAEMCRTNLDGITWRVKQVLARALAGGEVETLPQSVEEVRAAGLVHIERLGVASKAGNMRAVFAAYMGRPDPRPGDGCDGIQPRIGGRVPQRT